VLRSEELATLEREIVSCRRCPRLVAWREQVAREKRASFEDEVYWGRPVPGFGDPEASIVIFGLAPAAHGANRTGRFFTGDRSGDFLFASLHRTGFANQPVSRSKGDGLRLFGLWISAAVVCLGAFAWDAALRMLGKKPKPKFAHGAECSVGPLLLLGCYHPSQQNTFTGVLTPEMLDTILERALELSSKTAREGDDLVG
jgi:uracil-DNA glycosylase